MSKLIATYTVSETFNIPEGLDLNDKSQVEWYEVKYNILTVKPVDGEEFEIEPEGWVDNYDYKRPVETEIECNEPEAPYRFNDCECCGDEFDNEGDASIKLCYECLKSHEPETPNCPPEPEGPPPICI